MEGTIGEIRLWGGKFRNGEIPAGWAECNGQIIDAKKYAAANAVLFENYNQDIKEFSVPVIDSPSPDFKYIICIEGNFPRFD